MQQQPVVVQGSPVVVQGAPVANPHAAAPAPAYVPSGGPEGDEGGDSMGMGPPRNVNQGSKQEVKCRDPFFAILFYINVFCIVGVAAAYGGNAFNNSTNPFSSTYDAYYYSAIISAVVGLSLSVLGLKILMCIPETLIKVSLIFSVVVSGFWVVYSFIIGSWLSAILAMIFFALTCCYAYCVWSRIPWATVNLVTAITAVQANCGITMVAYIFVLGAAGWSIVWAIAFIGVFDKTYQCDANNVCTDPNYGYLFLLFVAYFFVHQVVQNCVHVTTAGVVGTWWLAPDDSGGCCSPAVMDSLKRTLTTSFGSICFGSLLAAIIQALRMLAHLARQQDNGFLLCLAECILACLQSIIEYFNKWAYIYVGLYGYSYIDAGKEVFNLFANRGWEAYVGDDLVGMTLFFVSACVGALTGCFALLLEVSTGWFAEDAPGEPKFVAFLLGFTAGLVLCSILLSVIGSGVNAVIVLFADKPQEFHQHYPELSARMREEWAKMYPGCLN